MDNEPVWERVIGRMRQRDAKGRETYKVPLTADNARDHLVDMIEEILDAAVYAEAELARRDAVYEELNRLVDVIDAGRNVPRANEWKKLAAAVRALRADDADRAARPGPVARPGPTAQAVRAALITDKEVAIMLGRSAASIHRDYREGRIPPPRRIGRSIRWVRVEIERWVADGCPLLKGDAR